MISQPSPINRSDALRLILYCISRMGPAGVLSGLEFLWYQLLALQVNTANKSSLML